MEQNLFSFLTALRALGANLGPRPGAVPGDAERSTFGDSPRLRRGERPPGFDYTAALPLPQLLRQIPQNPLIDAVLALHPALGVTARTPNPWSVPTWGVVGGLQKRW